MKLIKHLFLLSPFWTLLNLSAQQPLLDEWFWPNYKLYGNAASQVEPTIEAPVTPYEAFEMETDPLLFQGHHPTERVSRLLAASELPVETFTVEMWILDHVNQPIGSVITAKSMYKGQHPAWVLGYYDRTIYFHLDTDVMETSEDDNDEPWHVSTKNRRGYKRYFAHIVATYDGETARLYVNGAIKEQSARSGKIVYPEQTELEVAAYLENEPYMDLGNHILHTRLWNDALTEEEIQSRFARLQEITEKGEKYAGKLHFNAGPYLHMATQNSINITWETSMPTTAVVAYGKDLPLDQEVEIGEMQTIHEIRLEGLEPATAYYYEISAKGVVEETEQHIQSGILTFATAVEEDDAFSFVAFGDTEARPHINDRMGKWVWEERPNFVINLGGLTDGGQEDHKFEWNYEYFQGMTQLNSRIPVFPVAGNGESDLYWYKKYHKLPNGEAYYTYKYGNAEFFMLNSNEKEQLKPGGEQYEWLEEQLKNSTATWKFACHHHAAFSSDENDYGNTWEGETSDLGDLKVRELVQLYEKYGVDIVFYGHLHEYERTWPLNGMEVSPENGVVYLVAGGAGGNLEDFTPTRSFFTTKLYRGHHYCKIDIFDNQLYFKMYDLNGAMKDYMELKKP